MSSSTPHDFLSEVAELIERIGWRRFKYGVWVYLLRVAGKRDWYCKYSADRVRDIAKRINNLPSTGITRETG